MFQHDKTIINCKSQQLTSLNLEIKRFFCFVKERLLAMTIGFASIIHHDLVDLLNKEKRSIQFWQISIIFEQTNHHLNKSFFLTHVYSLLEVENMTCINNKCDDMNYTKNHDANAYARRNDLWVWCLCKKNDLESLFRMQNFSYARVCLFANIYAWKMAWGICN